MDIDGDNDNDLVVAGNLFTSEIETPRNDASYGLVLVNEGDFEFKPVNAVESGFFVPTDVKKLQLINILDKPHILVGNNNDVLKVFKVGG